MSSAICFDLDHSIILSPYNGLMQKTEFCMFYIIANMINESLRFVYEFLQLFKTEDFSCQFVSCSLAAVCNLFRFGPV